MLTPLLGYPAVQRKSVKIRDTNMLIIKFSIFIYHLVWVMFHYFKVMMCIPCFC